MVGTRFGMRESIFRKSRGFKRCSTLRSDFLNCPDIVLTIPKTRAPQSPKWYIATSILPVVGGRLSELFPG